MLNNPDKYNELFSIFDINKNKLNYYEINLVLNYINNILKISKNNIYENIFIEPNIKYDVCNIYELCLTI